MLVNFVGAFILLISSIDCKINYANHTLFRAIPVNTSHMEFLSTLNNYYQINFWKELGIKLNNPVDFVVHPSEQARVMKEAEELGLTLLPLIEDIQEAFDAQTVNGYVRRHMHSMNWEHYYQLDDIYRWLQDLSKESTEEIQVQSIGKSYNNRDIMSIKVVLGSKPKRSTVIVEGGIHAREWISPTFVMYFISQIVHSQTSGNDKLKTIGQTYEWYFVPVLNPDGYEYTHTHDRLWRKNRNNPPVDLNRNFNVSFANQYGASSEEFSGFSPFSEKESLAMSEFVKSKSERLEYYFAFHSYGQMMLIPYTYTKEHLDNYNEVLRMCKDASAKIMQRYNTQYRCGTSYETVGYMATGVSGCWVKRTFRVPYVLTIELRDNGNEGFALSTDKILPTCEEAMDGLISILTPRSFKVRKLPEQIKHSSSKAQNSDAIFTFFIFIILTNFD